MSSSRKRVLASMGSIAAGPWMALLPALFVLLIYLPALHYDLVWDDTIFLRDMPVYRDPSLWLSSIHMAGRSNAGSLVSNPAMGLEMVPGSMASAWPGYRVDDATFKPRILI